MEEDFYVPLITGIIRSDPKALYTRLHQRIRQRESNQSTSFSASATIYHMSNNSNDSNSEYEARYTDNGAPIFKRRIMRYSSSFSALDYRQHYMARELLRFYRCARGVRFNDRSPSRPPHAILKKNLVNATRHVMLCSSCNSWFHLSRDCLDCIQFNSNYSSADDNFDPFFDEHHNDDSNLNFPIDMSIED